MKMIKKISSLVTFLLLATTFNSYNMEQQQPGFIKTVRNILRRRAPINTLWQKQADEPYSSFAFTSLPKDMQHHIIHLLSLYTTADSLETAAFTINSLAQVNHELNELINGSLFCLEIIKNCAEKFNLSEQAVAKALKTKEAKRREKLQDKLYQLCSSFAPDKLPYSLQSLIEQGVNLEFTYSGFGSDMFLTPLMVACTVNNGILKQLCTLNNDNAGKLFNINQRNQDGETALFVCAQEDVVDNIQILLNAGADPEIPNYNGITPLQAAQLMNDQEIIDLIQNAIDKEHTRK